MEEMNVTINKNILLTYKEPWLLKNLKKRTKKQKNTEKQIKIVIMNRDRGKTQYLVVILKYYCVNQVKTVCFYKVISKWHPIRDEHFHFLILKSNSQ